MWNAIDEYLATCLLEGDDMDHVVDGPKNDDVGRAGIQINLDLQEKELQCMKRMASDIDAEIACLEGLDDWQADELARQATIRKRAVEKRIRDLTEGQP